MTCLTHLPPPFPPLFIKDVLDRHPQVVLHGDPAAIARLLSTQLSGDFEARRSALLELCRLNVPGAVLLDVLAMWRDLSQGT
ncbi:hypothetical protein B0H17DRAFT_1031101 [Mycena rosella]|uniref:Uncharacterized protein n=1 Tax=Mycena rosella TaxID=1033263 RepID=A0AAD7MB38_MYCRO|nr:hypothetical protein B0H17DRAFT_1031101 [Mycena rosella]